jgi:hypothetical protein
VIVHNNYYSILLIAAMASERMPIRFVMKQNIFNPFVSVYELTGFSTLDRAVATPF